MDWRAKTSNRQIVSVRPDFRTLPLASSRSPIEFVPYEKAYEAGFEDMPRRVPDLTKIGEYIGYRPTVALAEILKRVIEHTRTV